MVPDRGFAGIEWELRAVEIKVDALMHVQTGFEIAEASAACERFSGKTHEPATLAPFHRSVYGEGVVVTIEQKVKNVTAFETVVKVAAIGETPIAPLTNWYSLAPINPIGGR